MATHRWKCYQCKYIGLTEEFQKSSPECPKESCKSEDVFPYRIFKCLCCGGEAEQAQFFPRSMDLDPDPTENKANWESDEGHNPHSTTVCDLKKWEQIA